MEKLQFLTWDFPCHVKVSKKSSFNTFDEHTAKFDMTMKEENDQRNVLQIVYLSKL